MTDLVFAKRFQILLDEDRYARVKAEALRTGSSAAAVIRSAIDIALPGDEDRRRREAAGRFLALMEATNDEPQESIEAIRESYEMSMNRFPGADLY